MTRHTLSFLIFSSLFAAAGVIRAAEPLQWKVSTTMDEQIFPSLVYAMANLKMETVTEGGRAIRRVPPDMKALQDFAKRPLAVSFNRLAPGSKATIKVKSDSIMEPLTLIVDISRQQIIRLPIEFKYDALMEIRQSKPVNVDVSVSVDGSPFRKQTKTIVCRSVNDCPFFVVTSTKDDRGFDLGWVFAAYVNEDHPFVDQLLKEALATKIVSSFNDYQGKNEDQVWDQVRAIWTALSLRGIKYSNIVTSANQSEIARSQHVRFLEDSVRSDQANCVDGSVLIASVLQRIGIHPELVKIPGHMFLRFWLDPEHKHWAALETTLMGAASTSLAKPTKDQAIQAAAESFRQAWTTGNSEFEKESKSIFSPPDARYALLNIAEARKRGIIPIPYVRPNSNSTSSTSPSK